MLNRLLTGGKTAAFSNLLRRYDNVMKKNVKLDSSFHPSIPSQLNKTLNRKHTAFYWIDTDVLNRKEYECKVITRVHSL